MPRRNPPMHILAWLGALAFGGVLFAGALIAAPQPALKGDKKDKPRFTGVWIGNWQNSGGEDGINYYIIKEGADGRLTGVVMWEGPAFEITGKRLGRDALRFAGKTKERHYLYIGGMEDGMLVLHYAAKN